jgi:tetraacyldisaccharide-1-P 4'-kinase
MLRVMARSDWLIGSSESMTLAQFAQALAGKKLLGIAGIAQPQVLAASFAQLGFEVEWIFPGDHRAAELEANLNAPRRDVEAASGSGKDAIVMTSKDAVKYGDLGLPVFVLVQTLIAPEPLCIELERIARGQPTA